MISLVTGGSGFIGQHLVDQLVLAGSKVRILDIEPPQRLHADVDYVQGSVTDPETVRQAMEGVRHVFHTAAIPHLWIPDPAMYEQTNVIGTRIVFDEALKAGVERAVHTSSATVLIDRRSGGQPRTVDESCRTEEPALIGPYARSKWRAEQVALGYADRMQVVAVLPTLPLGPGDHHLTPPSRMLLDFITCRTPAYVDCILNIIDVRDVAVGHLLASARGRSGQRYILTRHCLPMLSFLERLARITQRPMPRLKVPHPVALAASASFELWSSFVSGRSPIAPLAGVRSGLQPITFDGGLAAEILGLPGTALDETIKDAVAWLADAGFLSGERQNPAFAYGER